MKIGLSALFAVAAVGLAQPSAEAATLPAKPYIDSAVTQATFWKDHEKARHAHVVRKHRVAHASKHVKKKH